MKKFIQICSLLGLVAVFTAAASASGAQSNAGSQVAIPFSFNLANKAYDAGTYIVKLTKMPSGAAMLSIENSKTGDRQTMFLTSKGDRTGTEVKLVFETAGGRKYLTKVQTPENTFAIIGAKSKNYNVGHSRSSSVVEAGSGASLD